MARGGKWHHSIGPYALGTAYSVHTTAYQKERAGYLIEGNDCWDLLYKGAGLIQIDGY